MKFQKISTLIIWSENFRPLADWYKDTFNLKVVEELNHPQDTGVLYEFPEGDTWLWIGQHSGVHGKNGDPLRIMFNVNVSSVREAYDYLIAHGATSVASPFKAPTMEKYFATLADPDGNTVQIIGQE